jgi:NifU-like protein involved in Fe-S cluster formation
VRPPIDPQPLPEPVARLFRAPRHAGRPPDPSAGGPVSGGSREPGAGRWVHGEAGRRRDGAQLRFHLQLDPAGRVCDARFEAFGCPWTVAAAEWLASRLPGRAVVDLVPGTPLEWAGSLGVPVERLGRLLVIEDALRAAQRAALAGPGPATDVGLHAGPSH